MISIENLSKSFGSNEVLKGISFQVKRGEFLTILGSSGAGKSTLLRCINGLFEPSTGVIVVDGMEVNKANIKNIRKKVGFIFQNINVAPNLTVMTNVLTGTLGTKTPLNIFFSKEDREKATEAIEIVGLTDKINTRVGRLSGGQRQRVGIARVLVQNPKIILADEPVSSLDPVIGREILELLQKINKTRGTVIICNLHQLEFAKRFGQRIIGIRHGVFQFDKEPSKLQRGDLLKVYGNGYRDENVE